MTIYYWSGATGSQDLLLKQKDAITRLLNGDYNCNDLEKLRTNFSHPVYSFRLSRGRRLLFTTHHGYLHVLEYLPIHNYDNCKFLKHGVLDRAMINFTPISDEEKPVFNADSDQSTPKPLHYYEKRFIALSMAQETILQDIVLPAIINGAAGSGKTLISLLKLAAQHSGEKLLYLSKQQYLVSKMKSAWDDGLAPESITVEFKTYDHLMHDDIKLGDEIKDRVDVNFFKAWYNGLKDDRLITLTDDHAYQELYICSGFKRENYFELGERQSSIPPIKEARDAFYTLYERYLTYLDGAKKVDPAFHVFTASTPKYDLIVVDEGQNLSLMQNRQLAGLCNNAIIFCIDQHQNLVISQASRVLLEQSFQRDGVTLTTHSLDITHRCAHLVTRALDKVLEITRAIRGGKADKHEALSMHADPNAPEGEFYLMSPGMDTPSWIINRAKSTELAVVTAREFINEARERFNTALVFTPEEIIGQEFHTVVVYKLLSTQLSLAIMKDIKPKLFAATHKTHTHLSKDKNTNSADRQAIWINELFIACSRAKYSLVIIESESRDNACFLLPFKAITAKKPVDDSILLSQDWQAMSQLQAELGNAHIAARIDAMNLGHSIKPGAILSPSQKKTPIETQSEKSIISNQKPKPQFDKSLANQLVNLIDNQDLVKIKSLLSNPKLNINQECHGNWSALRCACYSMNTDIISALLTHSSIDVNKVDVDDATSLMWLAQEGNAEMIRVLLAHSEIDVNYKMPQNGASALIMAQGNEEVVRALLAHPATDVNYKMPNSGSTALVLAAQYGYIRSVKAILTHPAIDVNITKSDGSTALIVAAQKGHDKVIKALLSHPKIIVSQQMPNGANAWSIATQTNHTEVMIELLAHPGVDVNQKRPDGGTALLMAAYLGHTEMVRALLAHSATNVNQRMPDGTTALMWAYEFNHLEIFVVIIMAMLKSGQRPDPLAIDILWEPKKCSVNETKQLLENNEILKNTLIKIIKPEPGKFKSVPLPLLIGLIGCRDRIWSLLQSNDTLELTPSMHQALLTTIYESRNKPELEQDILYKALFKPTPPKSLGLFSDISAQPTIESLEKLLSLSNASDCEPSQAFSK